MANDTLKAVVIELTGGNVRNHHINLRGAVGLFPDDCLGASNGAAAAKPIALQIGADVIETDIDETKAIFRERGAIRRLFESENVRGRSDSDRAFCASNLPRFQSLETRF